MVMWKFVSFGLTLVLVFAWLLWWLGGNAAPSTADQLLNSGLIARGGPLDAPITITRLENKDGDGDGLADWEELELWGTNPAQADTDGDGDSDESEVERGSDPLVAGADQALDADGQAVALVRQAIEEKNQPLLNTDYANLFNTTSYTESDLRLIDINDPAALKNYGFEVARAMRAYNDPELENEMVLIGQAANGDDLALTKLELAADRHEAARRELLKLTVPREAAPIHLHLVNSVAQLADSSRLMAAIESEPALALAAGNLHPSRVQNFFAAVNNLNFYFRANNLSFAPEEGMEISLGL